MIVINYIFVVCVSRNQRLCACSIATWTWDPLGCRRTSDWGLSWWWRWENTSVIYTVWRKSFIFSAQSFPGQRLTAPHKLFFFWFSQCVFFLPDFIGFVDVETPTLFKRTPGVRSLHLVIIWLKENQHYAHFYQGHMERIDFATIKDSFNLNCCVSGSQRVCGSVQRAGPVLLPPPESTAV